jgi:(1->4)-alpha-D-glucan 1-alpha-D-glucosylmutase
LGSRRLHRETFENGDYIPLSAHGSKANHVLAFARRSGAGGALVVVPRLVAGLTEGADRAPIGCDTWQDTHLSLPEWFGSSACSNIFTGEALRVQKMGDSCKLNLSEALAQFPVGLFFAESISAAFLR